MHAAITANQPLAPAARPGTKRWHGACRRFFRWAIQGLLLAPALALTALAADGTEPLYHYEKGAVLTLGELGDLAPLLPAGVAVQSAQVRMPGQSRLLAKLQLADTARGPVLLDWQALVDPPFLSLTPPLSESVALAPVLQRHVPAGTPVLAWWDVSRQFALLAGTEVVFGEPLGLPLFVPVRWREQADQVRAVEDDFWRRPVLEEAELKAARAHFDRFVLALLAPEQEGMAALRELGGDGAVLVLHVRDLILLGQLEPAKLGVAFRDFGPISEVHGMIQRVRAWMRENDYAAYGLLQDEAGPVRAVALTGEASAQTLVARLLPLIGNDQSDVAGTRLVYRSGGYIVFEITGAAGSEASEARTPS